MTDASENPWSMVPPKRQSYHVAACGRARCDRCDIPARTVPAPSAADGLHGALRRGQMRAMRNLTTLLTIVGLAALGSSSLADKPAASPPVVGKPAPDFALKDLSGNE